MSLFKLGTVDLTYVKVKIYGAQNEAYKTIY